MNMRTPIGTAMTMVMLCVLSSVIAQGQGISGEILGTVKDPSGGAIQGAQIVIRNISTNEERHLTTDASGSYQATSLVPGTYGVQVTKEGFRTSNTDSVQLLVKQNREVDVTLQVGSTLETVQVSAAAVSLDTQDASQEQVITSRAISALPLNGGNYISLTHLSPGVVPINGQVSQGSGVFAQIGGRANTSVSIGGNREQDQTYTYDGVESKAYWLGAVGLFPPQDAIGEFKVQQGYLSPEFGPPAVVNVILKSGQDSVHGSAFEFLRNDKLDARNYFDTQKVPFRQNQFGITLGGRFPYSNKHHWFGYYQGFRIRTGSTMFGTVPSPGQLQGDFTDLVPLQDGGGCRFDPGNVTGNCLKTTTSQIIDPLTGTGFPTPNVIPSGRINSLAKALIPFFAAPNRPLDQNGNYVNTPGTPQTDDQFGIRTDHAVSNSDNLYGRFSYSNSEVSQPLFGPFPYSESTSPIKIRNFAIGWTHVFRPNLVNQIRFGYNNLQLSGVQPPGNANPTVIGFKNVTDIAGCVGFPSISIGQSSGYPTDSGVCFGSHDKDSLLYDNLSWVHGKHALSFGADIRRVSHLVYDQGGLDGSIGFFNAFSGNNTADFLLGAPSSGNFVLGSSAATNTGWWTSFYVNDDYRITNNLTLNVGLRYMNNGVLAPKEHNYSVFDFSSGTLLHPPQNGIPPGVANRSNTDFAPRIGLAYRVTNNAMIRSAYGIYYVDDPADELSFNASSPPTYGTISQFASTPGTLTYTVNQGLPSDLLFPASLIANVSPTGTADGTVTVFTRERNRRTPYVQNWLLSFQRTLPWSMLLDIAYVGNEGTHLSKRVDENTAVPLTGPPCTPTPVPGCDSRTLQERRPFPRWASVFKSGNFATSNYNSLQVKLQKDLSRGLDFLLGYTWSKAISEDDYDNLGSRNYSWLLLSADRSRAVYDRRQRFSMSLTYELPFARGATGVKRQLLSGWKASMINSFMTGAPFGVGTSNDYAQIGNVFGLARPDRICNGNLPVGKRTIQRWFDTSCFVAPVTPFPHLGNAGFNFLDSPGFTQVDLSAQKIFPLSETCHAEFRVDFFNAINKPNFGAPVNNIDAANDGTITSALAPRQIQLGLKIVW
jgi:hypothetical protein